MMAEVTSARAFVYTLYKQYEQKEYIIKEAAMAKLIATQLSDKVTYECMRFFGGYGYMESYPMARLLRDSQLGTIGGGTSEILCEIIAKMTIDTKEYKAPIK
jgi:alkylation response protein AidB-like acyl-CoA dehydrogenase